MTNDSDSLWNYVRVDDEDTKNFVLVDRMAETNRMYSGIRHLERAREALRRQKWVPPPPAYQDPHLQRIREMAKQHIARRDVDQKDLRFDVNKWSWLQEQESKLAELKEEVDEIRLFWSNKEVDHCTFWNEMNKACPKVRKMERKRLRSEIYNEEVKAHCISNWRPKPVKGLGLALRLEG
ncbi:MAG: hypothetical protein M1833_002067 [Piccolia ochrophora]|nr:MAG: hypothetical protein M1833_002067 [Piccolia ochrophora]